MSQKLTRYRDLSIACSCVLSVQVSRSSRSQRVDFSRVFVLILIPGTYVAYSTDGPLISIIPFLFFLRVVSSQTLTSCLRACSSIIDACGDLGASLSASDILSLMEKCREISCAPKPSRAYGFTLQHCVRIYYNMSDGYTVHVHTYCGGATLHC